MMDHFTLLGTPNVKVLARATLSNINLVTLTRSWAWVILEGDIGVNRLRGLYLRHQLTLHDLRTNVSCENWFTLSYILFCFEWL
jgi:hypothetical protein